MTTKTRNKYYNPNPLKNETDDCVVRALCKATDKDWDTVFKGLCDIAFRLKVMPNDNNAYAEYLELNGFERVKIPVKKGSKRPTVSSFAQKNRKGVFVLRVAHHVVTCVDGFYYDLYDSGTASVYAYWRKIDME